MRSFSLGALFFSVFVLVAVACRTGEPTSDPKTPANSPLPKVDHTESDPREPPKPELLGDAGL